MNPAEKPDLWHLLQQLAKGPSGERRTPYMHYHVMTDFDVDGFHYGVISDIGTGTSLAGDGFLVAPDGARCGLMWEVTDETLLEQLAPGDAQSWGVWKVSFPYPVMTMRDIERNLKEVIPELRSKWEEWTREKLDCC